MFYDQTKENADISYPRTFLSTTKCNPSKLYRGQKAENSYNSIVLTKGWKGSDCNCASEGVFTSSAVQTTAFQ